MGLPWWSELRVWAPGAGWEPGFNLWSEKEILYANNKLFYLLFSVNIVYNLHKTDTPLARLIMKQRRKESK